MAGKLTTEILELPQHSWGTKARQFLDALPEHLYDRALTNMRYVYDQRWIKIGQNGAQVSNMNAFIERYTEQHYPESIMSVFLTEEDLTANTDVMKMIPVLLQDASTLFVQLSGMGEDERERAMGIAAGLERMAYLT